MLKYPFLLIFLGLFVASPIIAVNIGVKVYWGMLAGFVFGGFFGFLYSAYMTTKWRIWAFGNVTDIHELKRAAIIEKYIPKAGSWLEKIEIRTASDKEALSQIEERFNEQYIFSDDLTIPDETQIYYSITIRTFLVIVCFLGVALIIYSAIYFEEMLISLMALLPIGLAIYYYNKLSDNNPQIVLNSEGIETSSSGFKSWKEIRGEKAELQGLGKHSRYYLVYQFNGGDERYELEHLDITPRKLNHLMTVYRNRFQNKQ